LGDGDVDIYGNSTIPRTIVWQVNNDYKFGNDPFNNPQPGNRLFLTKMTGDNHGTPYWADQAPANTPGTDTSMDGWRIGVFIVEGDTEGGTPYEDYLQVYLDSVTIETNADLSSLPNSAYPVVTMYNCNIQGDFTNSANGTVAYAENCYVVGNFVAGTTYRVNDCELYGPTVDFGSSSQSLLTNVKFNVNTNVLVAWSNTLKCDANTLFNLAKLGRTIVAYATSGDLQCVDTPSVLVFGNTDIGAGAGDVYLDPGFQNAAAGATDDKQVSLGDGASDSVCIIQGVTVRHNLAAGNGNAVTYEVLLDGASLATPITASRATNSASQSTSSAKPAFSSSSAARISLKATKPGGGIGSGVQNAIAVVRYYQRCQS